jgi:hypothetical protein
VAAVTVAEVADIIATLVQRVNGSAGRIAVDLSVVGGTAVEGTDFDYLGAPGAPISLQWANQDLSQLSPQPVRIFRRADSIVSSTIILGLALPATPPVGFNNPVPTINPDFDELTITILREGNGFVSFAGPTWQVEEPPGPGNVNIDVFLQRFSGSKGAGSVSFATVDGTAIAGTDYVATSGSHSWPDGQAGSKTISVPIMPRAGPQGSRSFTIVLSSPTGGLVLGLSVATVTIVEVAPPPNPPPLSSLDFWMDDYLVFYVSDILDDVVLGYGTELILSEFWGQEIGGVIGYGGVSEFTNSDAGGEQSPPLRFQVHEV